MLDIDLETVCYVIVKAREFEVEDIIAETLAQDGDEEEREFNEEAGRGQEELEAFLERGREDPIFAELERVIRELNVDQQCELVALSWLGRGEYTGAEEWEEVLAEAHDRHNEHTAAYLLGMPLLADYLEDGLSQLGLSCAGTSAWEM